MRIGRAAGLTSTVVVSCLGAWMGGACRPLAPPEDVPSEGGPPVFEAAAGPVVFGLQVTPNPTCVLSAVLTFNTNVPATASVTVRNLAATGGSNTFTAVEQAQAPSTSHSIALLGLRAASSFELVVNASDAQANMGTGIVTYATGKLPAVIPPIGVITNDPTRTSPGFTLMTLWKWDGSPANIDPAANSIVAVDAEGQVVWYYLGPSAPGAFPSDAFKLPNGDIAFLTGASGWSEIDMMGNLVQTQTAAAQGLDSLHDDLLLEQNGNYLGLSTQLRSVPGYPGAPDGGPAEGGVTYPVVGDVIAEMSPEGGVLQQWSTFDLLSPYSQGTPALFNSGYWNGLYPDAGPTKDWTHSNSVWPDTSDGTFLVSSATQSWIFKFSPGDAGTPSLVWRLGPGGDFSLPNASDAFQFNQNAVTLLPSGNVMCFDNGTFRTLPDGAVPPLFSRAVEFALDTTSMTATVAWQYAEDNPPFFSAFLGSAYPLPNGNILISDGGEMLNRIGSVSDPKNQKFARILEVTHDAVPVKVLDLSLYQPAGSIPGDPNFSGYSVSRARRITSLY